MRVRWTGDAADDLSSIVERIREENAAAALRVARVIYQGVALLKEMPARGRIGRAGNTRELIFAPFYRTSWFMKYAETRY